MIGDSEVTKVSDLLLHCYIQTFSAVLKLVEQESGDGWEYTVRCLLRLGLLHDAWRAVQVPCRDASEMLVG